MLDTPLYDKGCQRLAAGWWFSPGTPVSFANKTDHDDITDILLTVALSTIIPVTQNETGYLNAFYSYLCSWVHYVLNLLFAWDCN